MGLFGNSNKSTASSGPASAVSTKNAIARAFDSKGLKYQDVSDGGVNALRLGFGLENYKDFAIFVFVDSDGESYQLRSGVIMSVDAAMRTTVMEAVNKVNCDYRWARFYIDDDNDLVMQEDIDYSPSDGADNAVLAVMRAAQIMDTAYPEFMKARWA